MVEPPELPHIYPLGQAPTGTDPRFSIGVVVDVSEVLAKHGYPDILEHASGGDLVNLQQALFRFVYGTAADSGRHTLGCSVWASSAPGCDCRGDRR